MMGAQGTDADASGEPGSTPATPALPSHLTDSAGTPWAGRSFQSNPHAGDDGRIAPELAAALERFHDGDGSQAEVVAVFGVVRLLIPLLAELGDPSAGSGESGGPTEIGAHGHAIDKSQELSIVTVEGPDGRRVLPVFSSVETMQRWNAEARPVPADGVRVALAAADDGTELVVLDPGSPSEFVLRRPAVWAVAQSLEWQPAFESEQVREAFERSIGSELSVLGVELSAGDPLARLEGPELIVTLHLIEGLTRDVLDATTRRLAHRWAEDEVIATSVDSLAVRLVGGRAA